MDSEQMQHLPSDEVMVSGSEAVLTPGPFYFMLTPESREEKINYSNLKYNLGLLWVDTSVRTHLVLCMIWLCPVLLLLAISSSWPSHQENKLGVEDPRVGVCK